MAYYVYPSLTVNRFEHSLGVMHLADRILSTALKESDPSIVDQFLKLCSEEFKWDFKESRNRVSKVIRIVGLLHDLGHLPFSHTFEEFLHQSVSNILPREALEQWKDYRSKVGGAFHEFLTVFLISNDPELSKAIGDLKDPVLQILNSTSVSNSISNTLHEIVAGDIDADRGDYLLRDGYTSGAEFGRFDLTRLVAGMRLAKIATRHPDVKESFVFRPTIQALSAVESLTIERYKSYRWLYYHHRVVVVNRLLEELTWRILESNWDSEDPLKTLELGFPFTKPESIVDSNGITSYLDDIDLLRILRQAKSLLKTTSLETEVLRPANSTQINEFSALFDEVLQRKKRGISLWKDVGEYKDFNNYLSMKLEAIFENHQKAEYQAIQGRVLPAEDIHKTTENTEFALNWLAERLLKRNFAKRIDLERRINQEIRNKKIDGFLLLSLTFFKPWEYRGEREYEVIGRDGNLYHVSDVSPIVKNLRLVERSSIRLYAYFIFDTDLLKLPSRKQQAILQSTKDILAEELVRWTKEELKVEKPR